MYKPHKADQLDKYKQSFMKRTVIIDALKSTALNEPIHVCGWVRSRRGNKNVSFIALNDGSTIKNIQLVADLTKFSEEQLKTLREVLSYDPRPGYQDDERVYGFAYGEYDVKFKVSEGAVEVTEAAPIENRKKFEN